MGVILLYEMGEEPTEQARRAFNDALGKDQMCGGPRESMGEWTRRSAGEAGRKTKPTLSNPRQLRRVTVFEKKMPQWRPMHWAQDESWSSPSS
jgi:hypothetical protein